MGIKLAFGRWEIFIRLSFLLAYAYASPNSILQDLERESESRQRDQNLKGSSYFYILVTSRVEFDKEFT